MHENENDDDGNDEYASYSTKKNRYSPTSSSPWKYAHSFVDELTSIRGYNDFVYHTLRGRAYRNLTAHSVESSTKQIGLVPLDIIVISKTEIKILPSRTSIPLSNRVRGGGKFCVKNKLY